MTRKMIDLSVPCSNTTNGFTVRLQENLPVYLGHECYAYDLEIASHQGTYFETSAHVFRDGINTAAFPLDKLVLPGYCLRIRQDAPCITAADLATADIHGIAAGAALLIDVGPRRDHYFSRDAAQWMVDRGVTLMGSNTPTYDDGFENPTGFFIDLFQAEIPIIANLTNLDRLPDRNFTLIALPLHIEGVCVVPCRVVAMIGA